MREPSLPRERVNYNHFLPVSSLFNCFPVWSYFQNCLYEMKELFLQRVRMKEMIEFFRFDEILNRSRTSFIKESTTANLKSTLVRS